jgi:hypothetical protein
MIRSDKIKSQLFGGVGFRQSTLNSYDIVDAENQASQSGLVYQDASRLVTIKNIKESQENSEITDEQFNDLLKQMQESAIINTCEKIIQQESDFINSINLYPFEKTFNNTLTVGDSFTCFRIESVRNNTILTKISFIELAFDTIATFNIYLYNSNKPNTPIQTKEITTVANESIIVSLDWHIADDESHKGGNFYIGYFESDLAGALPIKRDYELSTLDIQSRCNYILPVKLTHSGTTIDVSSYTSESDTGGLNIGIETYIDYTETIVRNKNIFWKAIQSEMGIQVLDIIRHSTRSNRDQRLNSASTQDIDIELLGFRTDATYKQGLISKNARNIADIRKMLFPKPRIIRRTLS